MKGLVEVPGGAGLHGRARPERGPNAFPQFTARVKGIDLHFIHAPGKRPDAMPLLLSHGWPGSLFEFLKLIPLLQEDFTGHRAFAAGLWACRSGRGRQRFGN